MSSGRRRTASTWRYAGAAACATPFIAVQRTPDAREKKARVQAIEVRALGSNFSIRCWSRSRIDPVADMWLPHSAPRKNIAFAEFWQIGGGSVLRQHVGQFGVGANTPMT